MGYQNVNTPRIYVDWGSWLKAIGKFEFLDTGNLWANYGGGEDVFNPIFGLNPSKQTTFNVGNLEGIQGGDTRCFVRVSSGCFNNNPNAYPNYMAVLGHNYASATCRVYPETYASGYGSASTAKTEIINYGSDVGSQFPPYDGFTIIGISNPDTSSDRWKGIAINMVQDYHTQWADENFYPYTDDVNIGSFCYGRYYDFSRSVDLQMTSKVDMGTINKQTSITGSDISNSLYTPDMWGDLAAWELSRGDVDDSQGDDIYDWDLGYSKEATSLGLRRGKRTWSLQWKELVNQTGLSNPTLMPLNWQGSNYLTPESLPYFNEDSGDYDGEGNFTDNVLTSDDFYSSVYTKCLGSRLPFIFQPDKDNNNPDSFFVARIIDKSFRAKQVENKVYDFSIKIQEV